MHSALHSTTAHLVSAGQFVASLAPRLPHYSHDTSFIFDHRRFSLFLLFILLYYLFYMSAVLWPSFLLHPLAVQTVCGWSFPRSRVFSWCVCLFSFPKCSVYVHQPRHDNRRQQKITNAVISCHFAFRFTFFCFFSCLHFEEDR